MRSDHLPFKCTALPEEMLGKKRLVMCVGYMSEVAKCELGRKYVKIIGHFPSRKQNVKW